MDPIFQLISDVRAWARLLVFFFFYFKFIVYGELEIYFIISRHYEQNMKNIVHNNICILSDFRF